MANNGTNDGYYGCDEDDDDDDYYLNLDPDELQGRIDGVKKVFDDRKKETGEDAIVGYEGNYVYYVVDTNTSSKDVNTHVSNIIKDEIEDERREEEMNKKSSLGKDKSDKNNKNNNKGQKGNANNGKNHNGKKNNKK